MNPAAPRRRVLKRLNACREGFTLIELLAVIVVVALLIGAIVWVGYGKVAPVTLRASSTQSASPPPVMPQSADPVQQLKELIRTDALPARWEMPMTLLGVCACAVLPGDISYDVRKTNSLVSPFVADIRVSVRVASRSGYESRDKKYLRKYAYQDNRWIPDATPFLIDSDGEVGMITLDTAVSAYNEVMRRVLVR